MRIPATMIIIGLASAQVMAQTDLGAPNAPQPKQQPQAQIEVQNPVAPVVVAPITPQPPTEASDKYSSINRQLVPVGNMNEYELNPKKLVLYTNPFGYFFGNFSLGLGMALGRHLSIGMEAGLLALYWASPNAYGFTAKIGPTLWFRKAFSGFYLEPAVTAGYLDQQHEYHGWFGGPQLLAGWQWIWDSGFNINAGLGLGYYWIQDGGSDAADIYDGVLPTAKLAFGYAF